MRLLLPLPLLLLLLLLSLFFLPRSVRAESVPSLPYVSQNTSYIDCAQPALCRCVDATCGAPFPLLNQEGKFCERPCTPDDWSELFGPCGEDGLRTLVYYWSPPALCRGGLELPPPVTGVPCALSCPPGQRLDVKDMKCVNCTAGTFSMGGGLRLGSFSFWPPQLTTDCEWDSQYGTGCDGWVVVPPFLESSWSNANKHMSACNLRMNVHLVEDGYVRFFFQVEGEKFFDGLRFYINGEARGPMEHQILNWKEHREALAAGYYELVWSYEKDSSVSVGADMARIRSIEIGGLRHADTRCLPCKPGTYANPGVSECLPCPPNTFPNATATTCLPCGPDKFSAPGDVKCRRRYPCREEDYDRKKEPCINNKRIVTVTLSEPVVCSLTMDNAVAYPPQIEEDCQGMDPCEPGMQRAHPNDVYCSYCPVGFASPGGDIPCTECPAGTMARKHRIYNYFWQPIKEMRTSCDGECGQSGGWIPGEQWLHSGRHHGDVVESRLHLDEFLVQPGWVTFTFSLECYRGTGSLSFYVNDEPMKYSVFLCPETFDGRQEQIRKAFPLKAGNNTLTWVFRKFIHYGRRPSTLDRAKLFEIDVEGVDVGGASECQACPAGTHAPYAGLDTCEPCSAGTFSYGNGTQCHECEDGTFSIESVDHCVACGNGTWSDANHTTCETDCSFSPDGGLNTYRLDSLARSDAMYEAIVNGTSPFKFYLNMCTRDTVGTACMIGKRRVPMFACAEEYINEDRAPIVHNLGDVMGFAPLPGTSSYDDGLRVILTHGSQCGDKNQRRVTTIELRCDLEAGIGTPVLWLAFSNTSCTTYFLWRSERACPICTSRHTQVLFTPCVNWEQAKKVVWAHPRPNCFPDDDFYRLPGDQVLSCHPFGITAAAASVLIALLGVILFLVLFFKYRHYRRLYSQYERIDSQTVYLEDASEHDEWGLSHSSEPRIQQ